MSKMAGLRIGHEALEQALAGHGIEAAVVGDDRSVLAVYSSAHPEREVRRLLVAASGLAPFHVKARAVDVLPRLESGKVDYERLRAGLEAQPTRRAESVQDIFQQTFFPHRIRDNRPEEHTSEL